MNTRPAVLGEEPQQLELLVGQVDPASGDPRLVAGDVDDQLVDLDDLVGAEGGGLPVELAQPRVQLGRHDRHQHEVVEPDREVERRAAGPR